MESISRSAVQGFMTRSPMVLVRKRGLKKSGKDDEESGWAMERCWSIEPTSERIIADILGFSNVLAKIAEAKGCVVSELALRHGHRLMAHNGGRVLKRKVTKRQRKGLLVLGPVHPDAVEALVIILGDGLEVALGDTEIADAQAAVEEHMGVLGEGENDPEDSDSEGDD